MDAGYEEKTILSGPDLLDRDRPIHDLTENMQRPLVAVQLSTKEAISVTKKLPRNGNGPATMVVSLLFINAIHARTQRLAAVGTFWAVFTGKGAWPSFQGKAAILPPPRES